MNVQKMFKSFIRPATATRTQTNKAARIPKNELIDALHACFDEYSYWSMKALKGRTRQPEAYLKEVLQEIAVLVKAGPFASTWKRMSMYEKNVEGQKEEAAPEQVGGDDDDDDEEMENVI
jgi:transcription initiation factor TFIIF subunit beta